MNDELKRIRDLEADAAMRRSSSGSREEDQGSYSGFIDGFDFALTQLDKIECVALMREAIDDYMAEIKCHYGNASAEYSRLDNIRKAFDKLVGRE